MASRQEEKARRRAEREAAEAAEAAARARRRRLQLALAGLLAIAVIGGVVLAATGGGGGDGGGDGPSAGGGGAPVPAKKLTDLDAAAKAAGCELKSPPIDGSSHVQGKVTYKTNPPTSGDHSEEPALDGVYPADGPPAAENALHAYEHGRIAFQYRPGTPAKRVAQLQTLANEPLNGKDAYKMLLFRNPTRMPYAVAATAWGQALGCRTFGDAAFDALRAFRIKYVDKGPEVGIPPNN